MDHYGSDCARGWGGELRAWACTGGVEVDRGGATHYAADAPGGPASAVRVKGNWDCYERDGPGRQARSTHLLT